MSKAESTFMRRWLLWGVLLAVAHPWGARTTADDTLALRLDPRAMRVNSKAASRADSLTVWQQRLEANPNEPELFLKIADHFLLSEEEDSAEIFYRRAIRFPSALATAWNGIGCVFYQKGESKIIPFEKLKALFDIDNRSKAIKAFGKALEASPGMLQAHYNLGMALLLKHEEDAFPAAQHEFELIQENFGDYFDSGFQLGYALHSQGKLDEARRQYERYAVGHPDDLRPAIRISEVYFEMDRPGLACQAYLSAVARLSDPETLEEITRELKFLMTPAELNRYATLPINEKGEFIREFWIRRDPTPMTALNERLVEHYRRVKYAREVFFLPFPPYFDDRGKIYIKYGEPDDRYITGPYTTNVRQNESWSYERSVAEGVIFDFVLQGGFYREVPDLTDAAAPGTPFTNRVQLAGALYAERAYLGGTYGTMGLGFDDRKYMDLRAVKDEARIEGPAEAYRHEYGGAPLNFSLNVAQFRGESNTIDGRVIIGVPGSMLTFEPDGMGRRSTELEFGVLVQDSTYQEVARRSRVLTVLSRTEATDAASLALNVEQIELHPQGRHRISVQVRNPESRRIGIYRFDYTPRSYDTDSVQLSDVVLAFGVEPNEGGQDRFVRNGFLIRPIPHSQVSRRRPLFIYFEVYNLAYGVDGATAFTVEYTIKSSGHPNLLQKALGVVRKLFGGGSAIGITTSYERVAEARSVSEYISLDLSNAKSGPTELTVRVVDLNAGLGAQTKRRFDLI